MIFLLVLASYLTLINGQGFMDLCNPEICHRYKDGKWVYARNIGCNNPDQFGPRCPGNAAVQNMNDDLKKYILDMHNKHRNKLANGNLAYFPQASKMATMQWNNELEYLAQLNGIRCYYGADDCRNTKQFSHVGQNIDLYWNSTGYWSNDAIIKKIFNTWFKEHQQTNLRVIDSYFHTGLVIGHFTQIVSSKSAYIGCAMTYWTLPHGNHFRYYMYFVCNYSYTNYVGQPVYEQGTAASKCTTGSNPDYPGLCSIYEVFNPEPVWVQTVFVPKSDSSTTIEQPSIQSGTSTSGSATRSITTSSKSTTQSTTSGPHRHHHHKHHRHYYLTSENSYY